VETSGARFISRESVDELFARAYTAAHRLDGRASVPAWDLGLKQRRNVPGRSPFALRRLLRLIGVFIRL
jgi:hypothetical protein